MRESTFKDNKSATVPRNYQSDETFRNQNKVSLNAVSQRLPLINPEAYQSKLYESIVDINKNYLAEKVKVCQVKKPQQYEHKLPSKTGVSEYNRRYAGWKRSISLAGTVPEADKSGSLMKQPNAQITNFKTNYQADYSPQRINCLNEMSFDSKIKNQKVVYRDQRPFFKETAYQRDFSIRQNICTDQPAKILETLRVGGKFNSQTTYKQTYRNKNYLKTMPNGPILPVEHKIFVKVGEPGKSNYQQSYLQRQIANESSFKPQARQLPQFKSMGLKSEYKKVYEQKQHRRHTDFECLDEQKLRQYVLGLSQS